MGTGVTFSQFQDSDSVQRRVTAQPELVAHHYTEAGLIEQALPYWQ